MTSPSSLALRRHLQRRTAARWQGTRSNIDTSSIDFPDEIIELILSKCPVKSAVRFISVSKSWQSIISNPRFFRNLQSKLSSESKNKFLIWTRRGCKDPLGLYLIRLEDGKIRKESLLGYPSSGKFFEPLSSCDGLILLHVDGKEYMLWNPLIRKHIIIPAFRIRPYPWMRHLYFDSTTNDHKIVFIYNIRYTMIYSVYSCKNEIWGEIKDIPGDLHYIVSTVCVDGCIYSRRNGEIVCFDFRDGKMHKFPQPEGVERLVNVKLKAVSGQLCLYGFDYGMLQLWVMEKKHGSSDKCWRKLISMEIILKPLVWSLRPLCLSNEDDVVLCGGERYKYFMYNSRRNCFQEIEFTWELNPAFPDEYFPYSKSLYMLSSNCSSDQH